MQKMQKPKKSKSLSGAKASSSQPKKLGSSKPSARAVPAMAAKKAAPVKKKSAPVTAKKAAAAPKKALPLKKAQAKAGIPTGQAKMAEKAGDKAKVSVAKAEAKDHKKKPVAAAPAAKAVATSAKRDAVKKSAAPPAPVKKSAEKPAEKISDRGPEKAAEKPAEKLAKMTSKVSEKVSEKADGVSSEENVAEEKNAKRGALADTHDFEGGAQEESAPETRETRSQNGGAEKTDSKARAKKAKDEPVLVESENDDAEEIVLTDAEGRRYCRVKECDQLASVDNYCRYHYLLYWKNIQVRKKILTEGKLERYIEELTARYPDKYLDMLRKDLRNEKDFLAAIQELEIDEASVDNEYEDEAQSYLEEVRGMSGDSPGSGAREDEDF